MNIFVVSEKSYEIKQVREFLNRLPFADNGMKSPLDFFQEGSPKTALERLAAAGTSGSYYDLIIVSHKMKTMSGIIFTKYVVGRKMAPATPIMLIVENTTKEIVTEAMGAGVSGFFSMPLSVDGFRTSMTRLASILVTRAQNKIADAEAQLKAKAPKGTYSEFMDEILRKGIIEIERCAMYAPWLEDVHAKLAAMHLEHGDFAAAVPRLKAALKVNPTNRESHRMLLACYKKTGQAMEESATLKKLLAANPGSPDLLNKLGDTLLHEGNYHEAVMYFKKAIAQHRPGEAARLRAKSHVGLGKAYMTEGDETGEAAKHELAKEQFAMAVEVDSTMVSAYLNLIASYKKLGMDAEAKAVMAKAADIAPDNAEGWLDLFSHYLEEGEMQKAKASLQRAMKFDPENQITLVRAAQAYFHNRMFGEAAALFEKAVGINPSDTRTFNYLGICYRRMDLLEQAAENFKKAILIDPEDHNLYFNLGRAYQQAKDIKGAREAFESALKIAPDFAEAKEAIASIAQPAIAAGATGTAAG